MPPTLTEERPTTEERVSRIEGVQTHLATKADVAEVRTEIAESEARTATRIAESEARTTAQIAEVRAEMAKFETRMVRWMIASLSLAVAIVTVINRVMG